MKYFAMFLFIALNGGLPAGEKQVKLPFSAARLAGATLYVSGQVARTPDGKNITASVEAETRQVMENLKRVLEQNGYAMDNVVRATVYLRNISDYAVMNRVYAEYFKDAYPARACVGGIDLVLGFDVEISCIAYKAK